MPETICAWCKHLLHCLGFVAAKHGLIFAKSFWVFNLSERLKREAERNLWQVNDESSSPFKEDMRLLAFRSARQTYEWSIIVFPFLEHFNHTTLWATWKIWKIMKVPRIACQCWHCLSKRNWRCWPPPWMELPSTHALQQVHSSGDPESASDRKPHHRKNPSWESRKNNTRQIQSSILLASFKMLQTTKQEHLHYPPSRFTRSGRLISRRLDFTAKHGLVWFPSCKKPAELQWAKGAPNR